MIRARACAAALAVLLGLWVARSVEAQEGAGDTTSDVHTTSERRAAIAPEDSNTAAIAASLEQVEAVLAEAVPTTAVAPSAEAAPVDLLTLPDGLGLPLGVHVGMAIVDLLGVDENEEKFTATLDARITWTDRRLAYPAESRPTGWLSFRGEEADEQLTRMWHPPVRFANMDDEPSFERRGLRIGPEGEVELLIRVTASFHESFDVERFPFDRQRLVVTLVADGSPRELVALVFRQDDLDYTRVPRGAEADGWYARSIDLSRRQVRGWHGESHDAVDATLVVERAAAETAAPIFIPLFASLIIPLLAIWLNKLEEGEFKIEAFELANVIVGGLFAVIALNFTVSSELATLAHGDNTVARLFSLCYMTLAVALAVNLVVFRYRFLRARFGPFVEEEVFRVLTWGIPTVALGTAVAFVLVAYA